MGNTSENMGEVIRFVPNSEWERARLIREARAMYDSVFPPSDSVCEQPEGIRKANAHRRRRSPQRGDSS
jgi:hypothetical protein